MKILQAWSKRAALVSGLLYVLTSFPVLAIDPPHHVIRLSYQSKNVSFSPAGEKSWFQATTNRPIYIGDRLWTPIGSRSELQLNGALFGLGEQTSVSVVNFTNKLVQLKLSQGQLNIHIRSVAPGLVYEIDTPNLAFMIRKPGYYKLVVPQNRKSTLVKVVSGSAEVYGAKAAYRIQANKTLRFYGTNLKRFETVKIANSPFDSWFIERTKRSNQGVSRKYVSESMIGYEDLDSYGSWTYVKKHGRVWTPSHRDPNWAPYSNGRWAWIDPWGWTWVDEEPWGFAPYHYGRWTHMQSRWYWVPGPRRVQAVYAPALVAFIGNKNFGLSFSIGGAPSSGIGWFPLGPGEAYIPSRQVSQNYFTTVNNSNTVINNTTINNIYNNPAPVPLAQFQNVQATPQAVTVVPTAAFVGAESVSDKKVEIKQVDLEAAPVSSSADVAPEQSSIVLTDKTEVTPPQVVVDQAVVGANAPPVEEAPKEVDASKDKDATEKPVEKAIEAPAVLLVEPVQPESLESIPTEDLSEKIAPEQPVVETKEAVDAAPAEPKTEAPSEPAPAPTVEEEVAPIEQAPAPIADEELAPTEPPAAENLEVAPDAVTQEQPKEEAPVVESDSSTVVPQENEAVVNEPPTLEEAQQQAPVLEEIPDTTPAVEQEPLQLEPEQEIMPEPEAAPQNVAPEPEPVVEPQEEYVSPPELERPESVIEPQQEYVPPPEPAREEPVYEPQQEYVPPPEPAREEPVYEPQQEYVPPPEPARPEPVFEPQQEYVPPPEPARPEPVYEPQQEYVPPPEPARPAPVYEEPLAPIVPEEDPPNE